MRYKFLATVLILLCFLCADLLADPQKSMMIDGESEALVRIFVNCSYTILLKSPENKEIKIAVTQMGNGFFAGEHRGDTEFIVSAGHPFLCNSTIGNLDKNGIFQEYQKNSKESVNMQNIVGLKDSKVSSILAYTFDGGPLTEIKTIYVSPMSDKLSEPDRALIRARIDESFPHTHVPLLDDKVFDEIFYKDGIKKSVYVRGFLSFLGSWFVRYKDAEIEWIGENTIQVNEHMDAGLSGSPLRFNYNNIVYAIGVVSSTPIEQTGRFFDWSWVSIVKKSFLDTKEKKK